MGLDLVVEGCAQPGHDREWRQLLKRSFADEELSEAEANRFREISIPGYERIGAPRVGYDSPANEWIVRARGAKTPEESAAVLKEFEGYYVVRLVDCDGVPKYSNAGAYEGADETSFRPKEQKYDELFISEERSVSLSSSSDDAGYRYIFRNRQGRKVRVMEGREAFFVRHDNILFITWQKETADALSESFGDQR